MLGRAFVGFQVFFFFFFGGGEGGFVFLKFWSERGSFCCVGFFWFVL